MEKVVLKATRRSVTGKQVKALRRQGQLPGVIYGFGVEPIAISLDAHNSSLVLPTLSSSTIVTIDVEGKSYSVLVREKQKDYIKNRLVHVDFQSISMNQKIRASVRLDISGVAPAVKEHEAVIVTNLNAIDVEALPGDLPERLAVDISGLENIGDSFLVRDLEVSSAVQVLTSPDEIIVVATGPAPEEIEPEVVEESVEPEVIERGKKDEDEAEEE